MAAIGGMSERKRPGGRAPDHRDGDPDPPVVYFEMIDSQLPRCVEGAARVGPATAVSVAGGR
jgi:hypothetical protein